MKITWRMTYSSRRMPGSGTQLCDPMKSLLAYSPMGTGAILALSCFTGLLLALPYWRRNHSIDRVSFGRAAAAWDWQTVLG
jgi:hypothetical protein